MRPRKHPLPLTLDNVLAFMVPGMPMTAKGLGCTFGATPAAVLECIHVALADGRLMASDPDGRHRQIFWKPLPVPTNIATRRVGPAEIEGTLQGYDAQMAEFRARCLIVRR